MFYYINLNTFLNTVDSEYFTYFVFLSGDRRLADERREGSFILQDEKGEVE